MKRGFLIGFAAMMLLVVAGFILRGVFFEKPVPVTPPLGPSLPTTEEPVSEVLAPLGMQDRLVAEANIEKAVSQGEKSVKGLLELCSVGSALEQRDALVALFRISSDSASVAALQLLDSGDNVVQHAALTVCARTRTTEAAGKALELTHSEDILIRARAARAIGFLMGGEALTRLVEMLDDEAAFVRASASETIEALTFKEFGIRHSGYPSERERAINELKVWLESHGGSSRFEWLQSRMKEAIVGLSSENPWERYSSDQFVTRILGPNSYSWDLSGQQRSVAIQQIRKKWSEYRPLFETDVPLQLKMEL
ncbi:MAG: HEAT repeat domain-containing protein [Planctomycetota bacterium]|nr:HEAT repeat domain-containing protein [Planctomycetota bacterium]